MNTQEAYQEFSESTRQSMLRVDNTDDLEPGMTLSINDQVYMIMIVLNDNDLSIMKHETGVSH